MCCILVGCGGGGGDDGENPLDNPTDGPPAGNPNGTCAVPAEAALEDTSTPAHVVGTGTKESCTGEAFAAAVVSSIVNSPVAPAASVSGPVIVRVGAVPPAWQPLWLHAAGPFPL